MEKKKFEGLKISNILCESRRKLKRLVDEEIGIAGQVFLNRYDKGD